MSEVIVPEDITQPHKGWVTNPGCLVTLPRPPHSCVNSSLGRSKSLGEGTAELSLPQPPWKGATSHIHNEQCCHVSLFAWRFPVNSNCQLSMTQEGSQVPSKAFFFTVGFYKHSIVHFTKVKRLRYEGIFQRYFHIVPLSYT